MSKYPNSIDDNTTIPPAAGDDAVSVNANISATLAIETELGLVPSGPYATVRTRLDILEARIGNPGAPKPDVTNPFFLDSTGVTIETGFGSPTVSRIPGSLYLREDGYVNEGLYAFRPDGYWHLISTASGTFTAAGDLSGSNTSQTVIGIQGRPVSAVAPATGQVLEFTGSQWAPTNLPSSLPPSGSAGGDLSGTYPNPSVVNIHGASVPTAGSLVTGNVLQVIGTGALTYAPVNLAGGLNFVTGSLPVANQAPQTMLGDVTGTTAASTVVKLQGNAVKSQTLGASQDGYVLVWVNANSDWEAKPTSSEVISLFGDVTGNSAASVVSKIQGNAVKAATPTDAQLLQWIGSNNRWEPTTIFGDVNFTDGYATVTAIQNHTVKSQTLSSIQDGYVLTWVNANNDWEAQSTTPTTTVTANAFWVDGQNITGNASDSNPGTSAIAPKRTAAGLYQSWQKTSGYGKPVLIPASGTVVVTFLSTPVVGDPVLQLANVRLGGIMQVLAPAATVATTDTIASIVTTLSRVQNSANPWQITGTSTAHFAPFAGKLLVDTTRNTCAWVDKNIFSGSTDATARMTQFFTPMTGGVFATPTMTAPSAGDTFQILNLTSATMGSDVLLEAVNNNGTHLAEVFFYRWNFTASVGESVSIVTGAQSFVLFQETTWGPSFSSIAAAGFGAVYMLNCWVGSSGALVQNGGTLNLIGGGTAVLATILEGSMSLDGDFLMSGNQGGLERGVVTVTGGTANIALLQTWSGPGTSNPIFVGFGANAKIRPEFYSSIAPVFYGAMDTSLPSVGPIFSVAPGGLIQYSTPATTSFGFVSTSNFHVGQFINGSITGGFGTAWTLSQLGAQNGIIDPTTGAKVIPWIYETFIFQEISKLLPGYDILGDGYDGYASFSGWNVSIPAGAIFDGNVGGVQTYHLTRDVFYTDCVIGNPFVVNINTNGFRIHCTGTVQVVGNQSVIQNNGFNASNITPGAGGLAGSLAGGGAGGKGGSAGNGIGQPGTSIVYGLPNTTPTGGAGGTGTGRSGTGGSYATVPNLARAQAGTWSSIPIGGGTGGGGGGGATGFGGGGGGGGGTVWIAATNISHPFSGGAIQAIGGTGGNASVGGNGDGGGGGGGGNVVLIAHSIAVQATLNVSGGAHGNGTGTGTNGQDGYAGNVFTFLVTDVAPRNILGGSSMARVRLNSSSSPIIVSGQVSILCDVSSGTTPLITTEPAPYDGQILRVANTSGDASVNNISVAANGGQTIEDPNSSGTFSAGTVLISTKGASIDWVWDSNFTHWKIV